MIAAFVTALVASFALTPVAIFLGHRTGFCDQPGTGIAYKIHSSPTPYLGGAAVIAGFLLSSAFASDLGRLWPLLAASVALGALGTVDDRINLSPRPRLVAEFALASALWSLGLGWEVFDQPVLDLLATNLWVVGVANSFNLMDNMDGVTATVASITALAAAVLAASGGDVGLAVLSAGLAGACAGFLPWNARPARIFLGDGGSLPIGFVIAVVIMLLPDDSGTGWTQLLLAPVLVGLPLVDTILRMTWRHRAGVPFLQGGQDSLTHIAQRRLGSTDHVAWLLGGIQGVLAAVAIGVAELGRGSAVAAWSLWFVTTTACVVLLERHAWGAEPTRAPGELTGEGSRGPQEGLTRRVLAVEAVAILFIAISCGLSPALYGFYRLGVWAPIALVLLAGLLGLLIARPAAPRRTAVVAVGGLTFLWLWSLLSSRWAESADQATTDANRWMFYAALFAILVLLLRDDRLGKLLIGCAGAAVAAFGGYLVVRLLGPAGNQMFLDDRLHEPLGYINGQAGYLMLGLWPLIALAERARNHVVSGVAISGAAMLGGLAILSQARAIVPALVVSAVVLVAVLPGRRQRLWALVAVGCAVGLAAGPLVDVYESGKGGGPPDADTLRTGILTLLASSALAGTVWALVRWGAARAGERDGRGRLAWLSAAGLAAIVLVAVAAGLAVAGNPADRVRDEWQAFKSPGAESTESGSRFTTGSGNRYDYWRIALNQFEDEPLKGVGAGNYDRTYFVERRSLEDIRQPHSLPLQALAELGIVGLLGVLLFLGAVVAGFTRRARAARASATDLSLAVAGGGMFLVWLVHTSVDWLHLIPGVTGIALCGAAVLVAPWTRSAGAASRSPLRIATIAGCALLVLVGATLVGRAALADKYRSDSQELVEADPRGALAKADDSLDLNDESLSAYYAQAAGYARLNDYRRARGSLLEATRREPHDFVPWALLGDLAVRRGEDGQARRYYRRALRLNPRDSGLREVAAGE